ncbi:MAG: thiamine phosphate synthase [Alphaproteobacteria bacterium]
MDRRPGAEGGLTAPTDTNEWGGRDPKRGPCRLYLITPPVIDDLDVFADLLREALDGGDVACLQLRLKHVPEVELQRAYERLGPIARDRDVAVIVNDRPDLAVQWDADGAHVGQQDMPADEARRILGRDRILGITCHASRHLAMEAGEGGADYVAFGAFFPSSTKDAPTRADPKLLTWWSELFEIPCVAIGGITVENAGILVQAGADFLAVAGGVWSYPKGPAEAVAAFTALFDGSSGGPGRT